MQAPSEGLSHSLIALILLSLVVGCLYVVLVRAGTPGDEPSHFDTVQYYARHWRLPVLGQPGVSYEGQMGPVFYYAAAVIYRVFAVWGEETAFYALRLLGLLLLVPTLVLTYRITRDLAPSEPRFALLVTLFTALNPSLLSIYASIQNDAITIVLSLWVTRLVLQWHGRLPTTPRAVVLGVITAVAILSKASAVFLVPAVIAYWWLTRRRAALGEIGAFIIIVIALTSWWFARNYVLYGDLTAQKGLRDHGYTNAPPPIALWRSSVLAHWLWGIETSYWLPIPYYRDMFHAPYWLRSVVGGFSVAAVSGWLMAYRRGGLRNFNRHAMLLLTGEYMACLALYIYSCIRFTYFAPRTTYPTFIVYAMLVGMGLAFIVVLRRTLAYWVMSAALMAGLIAANAYCLICANRLPVFPFHLFVSHSGAT